MRELIALNDIQSLEGLTLRINDIMANCFELEKQGLKFKSAEIQEQLKEVFITISWIDERLASGFYAYSEMLEELRALKGLLYNKINSVRMNR